MLPVMGPFIENSCRKRAFEENGVFLVSQLYQSWTCPGNVLSLSPCSCFWAKTHICPGTDSVKIIAKELSSCRGVCPLEKHAFFLSTQELCVESVQSRVSFAMKHVHIKIPKPATVAHTGKRGNLRFYSAETTYHHSCGFSLPQTQLCPRHCNGTSSDGSRLHFCQRLAAIAFLF